ncbi:MAG: hypothetical protein ACRDP8_02410 [Actinopolymorphaceae bacterium]
MSRAGGVREYEGAEPVGRGGGAGWFGVPDERPPKAEVLGLTPG